MLRLLCLLTVLLCLGAPAWADDGGDPDRGSDSPEPEDEERGWTAPDPEDVALPRVRLELWGRVTALTYGRFKKGPEFAAHTIDLHRDTRIPRTAMLGWRFVADLRFHEDWLIGGQIGQLSLEGNRRRLHAPGVTIQSRFVAPLRARTKVESWVGEVFLRYVVRDNPRVRFMLGAGVGWASFRMRVSTRATRTDGRVTDTFAPTIGYYLSIELFPPVVVFLESMTALFSPLRFPAYGSDVRLGLRLPLGGGVEIAVAYSLTSVQIEDNQDLWGGDQPHQNKRWRRATWTAMGADFGLSWRF